MVWPHTSGGNGHYYQAVTAPTGITWAGALAWAAAHGGYLATIGSPEENALVFRLIDEPRFWRVSEINSSCLVGPWLGGLQPPGASEPGHGWQWVHDEGVFTYTNWAREQPDDHAGVEDRLNFFSWDIRRREPTWNDEPGGEPDRGFVVEYADVVSAAAGARAAAAAPTLPPSPGPSAAAIVLWPAAAGGNGHFYQAVAAPNGITWDDANAYATAHGGYLATLTSAAENAFVFKLVDDPKFWQDNGGSCSGPWLGGFQRLGSPEPDGGWRWLNSEGLFTYTNWAANEPDDSGRNEKQQRLSFFAWGADNRQPTWDDEAGAFALHGFVVEYDPRPAGF